MDTREKNREQAQDRLDREIQGLARDVPPERDLWPTIAVGLDEQMPRTGASYWRWAGLAAAICAGLLFPFLLREAPVVEGPVPMATSPSSTVPPAGAPVQTHLRLRAAAVTGFQPGPEYETAREELLGLLEERLDGLAPEEREIVVRNIEAIRSALEQIDQALQQSPDDPLLQELLLKTYQTELDVMARVNGLAGPARRRTDL